jgi:hypothetical protein
MSNEKPVTAISENVLADLYWVVDWIASTTAKISFPSTNRNRAAVACFAIAQEHHEAILRLAEQQLFASSFALLRVVFEAYVRGFWLYLCATDKDVDRFIAFKEPPKLDDLLTALDSHSLFVDTPLSGFKTENYKRLCAFTHTGGQQVMRWNHTTGIKPDYHLDDVLQIVMTSEQLSLLSVLGIVSMGDEPEIALDAIREFQNVRDVIYPPGDGVSPRVRVWCN